MQLFVRVPVTAVACEGACDAVACEGACDCSCL